MKILFLTKKKLNNYKKIIEKLSNEALVNNNFDLFEQGVLLMNDICGLDGLNYARQMCEKRIKELEKELESEG